MMRRYSDPRIGDSAHGMLSLLRAKFQSFSAFGSSYLSLLGAERRETLGTRLYQSKLHVE